MKSPSQFCEFDQLPMNLLKKVLECLLPLIATIINKSLGESDVSAYFKKTHVRPLIKKSNVDKEVLENYRSVSNWPFLSKILEKAVAICFEGYLITPKLQNGLESAYYSD